MATITALETQRNDPERVNIFLDGEFAFGASAMVVLSRSLRVGLDLAPQEVEDLALEEQRDRTYNAALNFLSYRPRSRQELVRYFRRKKIPDEVSAPVLARLERIGLVDDEAFARFWMENRQAFRPRGIHGLRAEMRQKGLSSEVIDHALEHVGDQDEAAYRVARPKAKAFVGLPEREFHRKLVAFLQRRGFPYSVAGPASRRIYEELSGEQASDIVDVTD